MKPRLFFDVFCGAGGASDGYRETLPDDVRIVGVDIVAQPRYPYDFVQADALDFLHVLEPDRLYGIHASPPCQHYSDLAARWGNRADHPDLVGKVRELLRRFDCPWVIENVPEAPLRDPVILCGTMFEGLRVIRHRSFETNFFVSQPAHAAGRHPLCHTRDKRKAHYGSTDQWRDFVTVTGGGNSSVAAALDAMGIARPMTKAEVNEAIPPAYAAHVGRHLAHARMFGSYRWRLAG